MQSTDHVAVCVCGLQAKIIYRRLVSELPNDLLTVNNSVVN